MRSQEIFHIEIDYSIEFTPPLIESYIEQEMDDPKLMVR